MTTPYLLEMHGIAKTFSGVRALDGIDLRVRAGECVALCGENGAGKSTMMKVLSAVYPHGTWDGTILWDGAELRAGSVRETEAAGIVIIHQELMLVPLLSVAENIFLGREPVGAFGGIDFDRMYIEAAELLGGLRMGHIDVTAPVSRYAGGEQQLIEIAKALSKNARLLILDEPTSSLTQSETAILLRLVRDLKARGTACVYISHKLEEVEEIADTVTVIRDGRFVGEAPAGTLRRGDIIRMMVGRDMGQMFARDPHPIGETILQAVGVTCLDPDNPSRRRVDDVSFTLRRGEILGIAGLVGSGRTELVSAIYGSYGGSFSGEVLIDGRKVRIRTPRDAVRLGISMVPEDRKAHGIVPGLGVGHNITLSVLQRLTRGGLIDEAREFSDIDAAIARLRIKTATPLLPIANLSGGNQQKAVIARMLEPAPRILILDEPTRGVDVGAKFEIYRLIFALVKEGLSIVMVSSELPEILGLSDRILVLGEGRLRGDFVNDDTLDQERIMQAAIGQLPA